MIILWGVLGCVFSQMYQKVKLKDVDVLTLYQGKMTNGRRSAPVPQLQCQGGTAGCGAFVPEVVQCYNRGSDGIDVQWECKTDMDNEYRFGKISVSCEGYDYAEDNYVLAGSCGLEYTIDLTKGGSQQKSNTNSGNSYNANVGHSESDSDTNWGFIIILCFIAFVLYKNVAGNDEDAIPPAGTAPPPYNPGFIPPAGSTAPPPYSGCPPGQQGSQGWRPGFWSGMGAGWFGNSWFGNNRGGGWFGNNRGYTRHRNYHGQSNQSAYNQGFSDAAPTSSPKRSSSNSSSSRGSSGTRTASGFGGTSRR